MKVYLYDRNMHFISALTTARAASMLASHLHDLRDPRRLTVHVHPWLLRRCLLLNPHFTPSFTSRASFLL